jgi:hypothetical protein
MRLIDADRLKAEIMGWCVVTDDLFGMGKYHEREIVLQAIEESPTIDAVPVVRGEWIHGCSDGAGTEFCYCSECSEDALKDKGGYTEFSAFCPNCGCDMRGESDDIRGGF